MAEARTRVLMLCSGIGRENRGIETFFSDAFAGLKDVEGLQITLGIGAGTPCPGQERIWSMSRFNPIAKLLGKLSGRSGYTIEQMTSLPSVLGMIRRHKPHVVFTSEANLGARLCSLRNATGVPFKIMYSNGAPMRGPFDWADFVHQVTPTYRDLAIEDGDDSSRHILVPYGFSVPETAPDRSIAKRKEARRRLGLPEDRRLILSVGWIKRRHKRMDYVIEEIAKLTEPRPLFAMIGAMDEESTKIIEEAKVQLGADGFVARSVPPKEVATWYAAADVFVLGSLSEGFGRVYIEALSHGVPVFCHDYPVGKYVNGPAAVYGDFSQSDGLASLLVQNDHLFNVDPTADTQRWKYAAENFGWTALSSRYREMFEAARDGELRASTDGLSGPVT